MNPERRKRQRFQMFPRATSLDVSNSRSRVTTKNRTKYPRAPQAKLKERRKKQERMKEKRMQRNWKRRRVNLRQRPRL